MEIENTTDRSCINCNHCADYEYTLHIAHCGLFKSEKYPDKPMKNLNPDRGCYFYTDNKMLEDERDRDFA